MEDAAARAFERHRQRSYPLAIIATMAPMLGLLGTVIGMIEAFSKVAILGDTGDAAVLADSISKALITTDIGLVLAIPSLGAYHYLKQRISISELAVEEALESMFAAFDEVQKDGGDKPNGKVSGEEALGSMFAAFDEVQKDSGDKLNGKTSG